MISLHNEIQSDNKLYNFCSFSACKKPLIICTPYFHAHFNENLGFLYLEIFKKANMSKYSVVMIRHGESEWNQKNLFCGWFDSDLSDAGRADAEAAGKALKGSF